MDDMKKLGRGLDAIFGSNANIPPVTTPATTLQEASTNQVVQLNVDDIKPNRLQPRMEFPEARMAELRNSIKKDGVIQPILVRSSGTGYELISGERRWRVSKDLELKTVPAIIKNVDDTKALQIAIIENLQREDLNAIEKAKGFENLISKFKLTQEQVAESVGIERSSVSNLLRLLELPSEIQDMVSRETLTMGHARSLLGIESKAKQLELATRCIAEQLSVRKIENIVTRFKKGVVRHTKRSTAYISSMEDDLRKVYGTKVAIKRSRKRGYVRIEFYSDSDLDRIYQLLKNAK